MILNINKIIIKMRPYQQKMKSSMIVNQLIKIKSVGKKILLNSMSLLVSNKFLRFIRISINKMFLLTLKPKKLMILSRNLMIKLILNYFKTIHHKSFKNNSIHNLKKQLFKQYYPINKQIVQCKFFILNKNISSQIITNNLKNIRNKIIL